MARALALLLYVGKDAYELDDGKPNEQLASARMALVAAANALERRPAVTEGDVVNYWLHRVEDGSLDPDSMVSMMRRYGSMDPAQFDAEMRERLDLDECGAEDEGTSEDPVGSAG